MSEPRKRRRSRYGGSLDRGDDRRRARVPGAAYGGDDALPAGGGWPNVRFGPGRGGVDALGPKAFPRPASRDRGGYGPGGRPAPGAARPLPRPVAHRRSPITLGRIVALLFGFILAGMLGAGAYYAPTVVQAVQSTGDTSALSGNHAAGPPPPGQPFTVLLLGSDDDAKFDRNHLLTQSMILVRVDPGARQATMLSIPRDLWVPIDGGAKAKIDTAYEMGGARTAIATVESNFHVHVDDYVWIGLKGLVQLIDRVGGVDVVTSNPVLDDYYPADLDGSNPYAFVRVAVLPGAQHLGGAEAMKYVRSRHSDLRGDIGRSARQQQVLLALRAKGEGLNPADVPDLASAFQGEFSTSISLDRMRSMLGLASVFKNGNVKQIVLVPPYANGQQIIVGGYQQDVLVPDWTQILPLVHQSFPEGGQ